MTNARSPAQPKTTAQWLRSALMGPGLCWLQWPCLGAAALVGAAACLCGPAAGQAAERAVLIEDGFEHGKVDGGLTAGWFRPMGPYRGDARVVEEKAHRGRRSLRLQDTSPRHGLAIRHIRLPAKPGARYRASCWVLCEAGRARLYLEFFSSGAARVMDRWAEGGEPGKWNELAVEAVAPPAARAVSVLAYATVSNVGLAYFDDFRLTATLPASTNRRREPVDIGTDRQLLFDDFFTERREKVQLVVNPPRKTGIILLRADKPWESLMVNAWHTIMEDPDPLDPSYKYRLWYEVYWRLGDQGSALAYARSRDGIHWEKPSLGIIEFNGSRDNNLVFAGACGHGQHGGTVFIDPTAAPEQRYKYIYLGGGNVCGAVSADGLHWRPVKEDNDVLVKWSSDTQSTCFWDPTREAFVAFLRSWSPRMVSRTESRKFGDFPEPVVVLAPDEFDPPETDIYNNAALRYPYAARAYFMFPSLYHHPSDKLWVQLAASRDSVEWHRPTREAFIPVGVPGSWDEGLVYRGVGLIRKGEELWLSYYGRRATHNTYKDKQFQGAYSYAVSRLDGFVSMDAGNELGELVTVPVVFAGNRLALNIHTLPRGAAKVELLDEAGKPIPGYTQADCDEIKCDDTRLVVTWHGRADVGRLAGKPIRLRFVMRRCKLYAFGFPRFGA